MQRVLPFSTVTTIRKYRHVPTSQSRLLQPNAGPPPERTVNVPDRISCDNYLLDSESEGGWKSPWNQEILPDKNNLKWQKLRTLTRGIGLAWDLLCVRWTQAYGLNSHYNLSVYFNPPFYPLSWISAMCITVFSLVPVFFSFILLFPPRIYPSKVQPKPSSFPSLYIHLQLSLHDFFSFWNVFFFLNPTQSSSFSVSNMLILISNKPSRETELRPSTQYIAHVQLIQYSCMNWLHYITAWETTVSPKGLCFEENSIVFWALSIQWI